MMGRLASVFFIFISLLAHGSGELPLTLEAQIKQLVVLRQSAIEAENEDERLAANAKFVSYLRSTLNHPESFDAAFDTIPMIGDLRSSDGYFRMINWNVPMDDQSNRYYCFLQFQEKRKDNAQVIEFKTGYRDLDGEFRKVYSERDWYGALYYKIIPSKKGKRRKRAYMLLGWDGQSEFASLKVIDVLTITPRGIKLGDDIFDYPYEKNIKRFIIKYKADASVSMRYDEKSKRIVFNKLRPMQPDLEGMYEFYIPLLEFSAFEWKRKKWVYIEDVDPRIQEKGRIYNDPPSDQNIK